MWYTENKLISAVGEKESDGISIIWAEGKRQNSLYTTLNARCIFVDWTKTADELITTGNASKQIIHLCGAIGVIEHRNFSCVSDESKCNQFSVHRLFGHMRVETFFAPPKSCETQWKTSVQPFSEPNKHWIHAFAYTHTLDTRKSIRNPKNKSFRLVTYNISIKSDTYHYTIISRRAKVHKGTQQKVYWNTENRRCV